MTDLVLVQRQDLVSGQLVNICPGGADPVVRGASFCVLEPSYLWSLSWFLNGRPEHFVRLLREDCTDREASMLTRGILVVSVYDVGGKFRMVRREEFVKVGAEMAARIGGKSSIVVEVPLGYSVETLDPDGLEFWKFPSPSPLADYSPGAWRLSDAEPVSLASAGVMASDIAIALSRILNGIALTDNEVRLLGELATGLRSEAVHLEQGPFSWRGFEPSPAHAIAHNLALALIEAKIGPPSQRPARFVSQMADLFSELSSGGQPNMGSVDYVRAVMRRVSDSVGERLYPAPCTSV